MVLGRAPRREPLIRSHALLPPAEPFVLPVRVEFDECDLYGVVHHARYFIYMERARIAWLRALRLPVADLHGAGFGLVLVEDHTRYRAPARFGEALDVSVWLEKLGAASLTFGYRITRGETEVVAASIRLACVDPTGRPRLFPPAFATALKTGS